MIDLIEATTLLNSLSIGRDIFMIFKLNNNVIYIYMRVCMCVCDVIYL